VHQATAEVDVVVALVVGGVKYWRYGLRSRWTQSWFPGTGQKRFIAEPGPNMPT
jgi:hypothetical protein